MSDLESQRLVGANLPESDKFIDMAFPGISMKKSVVWIALATTAVYIVSCAMSLSFLEPSNNALIALGGAYGPGLANFQIYRLVFPLFLHASLLHLFFNLIFILHMGLGMEAKYGTKDFLVLYFVCGIVGNMLSMLVHPCVLSVGASTAGFGLIGGIITEIVLVWNKLSERVKNIYAVDIILFGLLMVVLSFGQTIDMFGHLGGFVAGVALICHFNKNVTSLPAWFITLRYVSCTICILIAVLTPLRVFFSIPAAMNCAATI